MNALDLIANAAAAPHTHKVVTTYDNGDSLDHFVRNANAAQMWAIGEYRKIGRSFISRETGFSRVVVSVEIEAL